MGVKPVVVPRWLHRLRLDFLVRPFAGSAKVRCHTRLLIFLQDDTPLRSHIKDQNALSLPRTERQRWGAPLRVNGEGARHGFRRIDSLPAAALSACQAERPGLWYG